MYLPSVLIHHMEASIILRLPAYPFRNGSPMQLGSDNLQQIQLDGLLNENDVVFTHSWKEEAGDIILALGNAGAEGRTALSASQ